MQIFCAHHLLISTLRLLFFFWFFISVLGITLVCLIVSTVIGIITKPNIIGGVHIGRPTLTIVIRIGITKRGRLWMFIILILILCSRKMMMVVC